MLRLGLLELPVLNPDESIYAARAAYLWSENESAFTRPLGVDHTVELYRLVTDAFGPYCLPEVRAVVAVICLATAIIIYAVVRLVAARWAALFGAILFLYMNLYFEGATANREWFALGGIMASLACAAVASKQGGWRNRLWWFAAGAMCGTSVYFKHQAVPFLFAVPVAIVLLRPTGHSSRWKALALYGAGLALAAVGYLLTYFCYGTLREHLYFLIDFRMRYAFDPQVTVASAEAVPRWQAYWMLFYQALPGRRLFLLAYFVSIVTVAGAFRRNNSYELDRRKWLASLWAIHLFAALLTVQIGQRFFAHYFLFIVPFSSAMVAIAVANIVRLPHNTQIVRWSTCLLTLLLLLDLIFIKRTAPIEQLNFATRDASASTSQVFLEALPSFPTMGGWLAIGILVALSTRLLAPPLARRIMIATCGVVVICFAIWDTGSLMARYHASPRTVVRADDDDLAGAEKVTKYLEQHANQGDRLFVWGFYPELYPYSRMLPGAQLATAVLVLGDVRGMDAGPPKIHPYFSGQLIQDLEDHTPRFIVDASKRSIHAEYYSIEHFPPLVDLLHQHYEFVGDLDGLRVYQRRASVEPRGG